MLIHLIVFLFQKFQFKMHENQFPELDCPAKLISPQVEQAREAIAEHESVCQYRLVNCVDLACQQR